jgi:hypothetical protein
MCFSFKSSPSKVTPYSSSQIPIVEIKRKQQSSNDKLRKMNATMTNEDLKYIEVRFKELEKQVNQKVKQKVQQECNSIK